jgi:pimeloyl-ACP methyl ester carboxylesterase
MAQKPRSPDPKLNTLLGTSRLVIQAVHGITDLVEEMHGAIVNVALPLAGQDSKPYRTRGITGMVYRSVRGVTTLTGWGIQRGLDVAQTTGLSAGIATALTPAARALARRLNLKSAEPYRETVRAAVNGVLGDTLAATENPLAINMQFRQQGKALVAKRSRKLLVLVHGLCMNDLQWLREGHDHGAMLAAHYGYEPIYLHYNTGRPIHENGADFAQLLESTVRDWRAPITELVIIGHSMGGLVTRSACHHAVKAEHRWLTHLNKVITLGTPHGGAPLERAGRGVDFLLGISPYSKPFARLGLVRSAGIQDLRFGAITPSGEHPLWPRHAKLYALATTKQKQPIPAQKKDLTEPLQRLLGDGLVPVKSALAQIDKPSLGMPLHLPASRQALVYETDHFQMLSSQAVARHLMRWLKA